MAPIETKVVTVIVAGVLFNVPAITFTIRILKVTDLSQEYTAVRSQKKVRRQKPRKPLRKKKGGDGGFCFLYGICSVG